MAGERQRVGKPSRREEVALADGLHGVWPTGQSGQGVGPVAGRIRLLGVGNLDPDAGHGLAPLEHSAGHAIGGRVSDAHQHRGAAFATLHITDRAAHPILAGDRPGAADLVGVAGDD